MFAIKEQFAYSLGGSLSLNNHCVGISQHMVIFEKIYDGKGCPDL